VVICALALDYVAGLTLPLSEFRRVLRACSCSPSNTLRSSIAAACKEQYPEVYAKLSEFLYFLSFRARCAGSTYDREPLQEHE